MAKMRKGTRISFSCPDEFISGIKVMGIIVGSAKEIRKMYPEEYAELPDNEECYLVKRNIPAMGIIRHYVVFPEEIMRKTN